MNDAARRWREAAGVLSGDPTARVRCPSCGADFLVVADGNDAGAPGQLHLTCPRCLDRHVVDGPGGEPRPPAPASRGP